MDGAPIARMERAGLEVPSVLAYSPADCVGAEMIEFRLKEKTLSLNESFRGDWRPRAAAAKRQRTKAMQSCPPWPGGPLLHVRLTRVSPRALDFANLAGALKHVQDGVASRLKVDDASALVAWHFTQAHGEAEVVVQIWKAEEEAPPFPVGRPAEKKRGKARREFVPSLCAPSTVEEKHKPSANYTPPRTVPKGMGMHLRDQDPAWLIERSETAPREAHGESLAFSRALSERLGEIAAREAEATFAPAPTCNWGHSDCCLEHTGELP